jgi:CRISPR/Cas system CSM-associated protein Csm2 small subunit
MTTLEIPLPESLHNELKAWAARENVSIEQLAASAVAEKVSALTQLAYLRQRASRGSREKFLEVLAKVPDVPPASPDTPAR